MHRGSQRGDLTWLLRSLTTDTSEHHRADYGMLAADRLVICHSSASHAAELAKHPRVHADGGPAFWSGEA